MSVIESVRSYDLNIPVGGAQNIDAMGDRVQFLSAVDPFAQIELRPNYTQGNISLKPGQGFRFSTAASGWVVFNKGTVPLTGVLLVGNGDFFDQRISGEVSVIDGGKARTMGGGAFMGYVSSATTQAANRPVVHYRNPAGSGKNVIVESILVSSSAAGFIGFGFQVAGLTTVVGNVASKLAGGAAGVTSMSRDELTGYPYATNIGGANVNAGGAVLIPLKEPIVLTQNSGIGISLSTVGAGNLLTATLEIVEELVS